MSRNQKVKIRCAAWSVDHHVAHYIRSSCPMVKRAIFVDSVLMPTATTNNNNSNNIGGIT